MPPKKRGNKKDKYAHKIAPKPDEVAAESDASASGLSKATEESSELSLVPIKYEGTKGKKCQVEVNFLPLLFDNRLTSAHMYDIVIDPTASRKITQKVFACFAAEFFKSEAFAYDGNKIAYTKNKLNFEGQFEKLIEVPLDRGNKKFCVKIQYTKTVDLTILKNYRKDIINDAESASALQCLDIIMRSAYKSSTAIPYGRKFFFTEPVDYLGSGMNLCHGLYQASMMGMKSMYLNVDIVNMAVPEQMTIEQYIREMNKGDLPSSLQNWQVGNINAHLQDLKISYQPKQEIPMKFKDFVGLGQSSSKLKFNYKGSMITVQKYFSDIIKVNLRYSDWPCIQVKPLNKNIFLPMELCSIVGNQLKQKICPAMIRKAATSTDVRKKSIFSAINKINHNHPDIDAFGVKVEKQFEKVDANVINPPKIKYIRNEIEVDPKRGTWRDDGFVQTQTEIVKFAIINCDPQKIKLPNIMKFKESIRNEARKKKVQLKDSPGKDDVFEVDFMRMPKAKFVIQEVFETCVRNDYKLVFIILNDKNDCYSVVKTVSEIYVGQLTQCIRVQTMLNRGAFSLNESTLGNLFLKLNTKLNGVNHHIVDSAYQKLTMNGGVMFVGADVTHPSPQQTKIPSVVGVVASYDIDGMIYNPVWRLQKPGSDKIDDFEQIMVEQLQFYKLKNGQFPSKLIYYRDGVGASQLSVFVEPEIDAIKKAFARICGDQPHPKVTVLVVQKRHHTRIFPLDKKFSDGPKNNNILPGTVIDKDIVSPPTTSILYQFYLASHGAIQGVTRPAKYSVLLNEVGLNADDMHAVTHALTHMFVRCTRAVSYPCCTYYAHLLAARAKNYILHENLDMEKLGEFHLKRMIKDHFIKAYPMFFV